MVWHLAYGCRTVHAHKKKLYKLHKIIIIFLENKFYLAPFVHFFLKKMHIHTACLSQCMSGFAHIEH